MVEWSGERQQRQGRLSRDAPSEKMEQFGRSEYLEVEKELDAVGGWVSACAVNMESENWRVSHQAKRS